MIVLHVPNFEGITVYRDGNIWFLLKKELKFFDRVLSECYEGDTLILKIESHQMLPIETEILFQNLKRTLKIDKTFSLRHCIYFVDNDVVKITDNPFYIFNGKVSKIYYNDKLIGRVKISISADWGRKFTINYEPDVEEEIIYYSTIIIK